MMDSNAFEEALRTPDLLTRVMAFRQLSKRGHLALPFLALLRDFILNSTDRQSEDVCVAVRTMGELLRSQVLFTGAGQSAELDEFLPFIVSELDQSIGVYTSSCIFALCLIGPSGDWKVAAQSVCDAVERQDERPELAYRAYQFASAVSDSLLFTEPWCNYIPPTESLRKEWNIHHILQSYANR